MPWLWGDWRRVPDIFSTKYPKAGLADFRLEKLELTSPQRKYPYKKKKSDVNDVDTKRLIRYQKKKTFLNISNSV